MLTEFVLCEAGTEFYTQTHTHMPIYNGDEFRS